MIYVLFGFAVLIGITFYILSVVQKLTLNESKEKVKKMPYILRNSVFNSSEESLYRELKKQIGDKYEIFTKVRIIDFIEVPNGSKDYSHWRNKIWAKHVDFLLCDKDFKPVVVIELDGKSHRNKVGRDRFVNDVFSATNIKIERINVGDDFSRRISLI